jgi:hypothetical protein
VCCATWNLIERFDGNLVFLVTEIDEAGCLTSAQFSGRTRFERSEGGTRQSDEGLLLKEPGLQVRTTVIDHGVPRRIDSVLSPRSSISRRSRVLIFRTSRL